MRVIQHLVRMKSVETIYPAKIHLSALALGKRPAVELIALQTIPHIIVFYQPAAWIEARQSLAGTDPQISILILQDARHRVICQTVFFGIVHKRLAGWFKTAQAIVGAQPQMPSRVFKNYRYGVGTQAGGIAWVIFVMPEASRLAVELVESLGGAHPQHAGAILINAQNNIPTQAVGIVRIMAVMAETPGLRVKAIQPGAESAKPHDPGCILVNGPYNIIAQAVRVVWIVTVMDKSPPAAIGAFDLICFQLVNPAAPGAHPNGTARIAGDRQHSG